MEHRTQFTMYESIYKSLQRIRNKKDRADAYDAICSYALYNKEPNLESASDAVAIAFELTRPVLDSARKKAENGKQGGSKTKANSKQTVSKQEQPGSENENEIENENEVEIEKEIEKESLYLSAAGGDCARARNATDEELLSIGIKPGEFVGLSVSFVEEVREKTTDLFRKYRPTVLPNPWDYRHVSRYCGFSKRSHLLDYAFEQAAICGKVGDWRYIDGTMDVLFARDIQTEEEARAWDIERPDLNKGE